MIFREVRKHLQDVGAGFVIGTTATASINTYPNFAITTSLIGLSLLCRSIGEVSLGYPLGLLMGIGYGLYSPFNYKTTDNVTQQHTLENLSPNL